MFGNVSWDDLPPPSDFRDVKEATECTDPFRLSVLSDHKDQNVRARVAENPYTPIEILSKFIRDTKFVQHYLIRNSKITPNIVKILSENESDTIQQKAYELLLTYFETGKIDMSGEELFNTFLFFMPSATPLEIAEYMEYAYELREKAKLKK